MTFERIGVKVAAALTYPVVAALVKLRLRGRPDPWRRTLGVGLRSEGSKFGLSAFSLTLPKQATSIETGALTDLESRLLMGVSDFLAHESDAHFSLRRDGWCDHRVPTPGVDVVLGRFDGEGRLMQLTLRAAQTEPQPLGGHTRQEAEEVARHVYNETRHLPEAARGLEAFKRVGGGHGLRVSSSVLMSVEGDDDGYFRGDRFAPPDFRLRRSMALGCFNLVFRRIANDEADGWLQLHHVGADGAPMQEILNRLEAKWGLSRAAVFPEDSEPFIRRVSVDGERELFLGQDFIDFRPLLDLRGERASDIPVAAWFLWQLGREPEFAGVRFAVAVDVPARGDERRAVDLISIRPADFASIADLGSGFRAQVEAARNRQSATWRAMRQVSFLPAGIATRLTRSHPELAQQTFGTVGLTMLRDAKVFLAPMADCNFDGGFIAIGSLALPRSTGTTACVTVKGTATQASSYPAIIRRVMSACKSVAGPGRGRG